MNIYLFELKSIIKSAVIWTFVILLTLYIFIVGVYPIFRDGATLIQDMAAAMPAEYFQAFGFDLDEMLGYGGFYGFSYLYFILIGGVMATSTALSVFGREKMSGCQDFLFAKPVARGTLFFAKLMAVVTAVALFGGCYVAASLYCFYRYDSLDGMAVLVSLALPMCQLVFVAVGVLLATWMGRLRSVSQLSATVGLVAFLLSALVNVLDMEWLRLSSPIHFFYPSDMLESGGLDVGLALWALVWVAVGVGLPALRYLRSDTSKL